MTDLLVQRLKSAKRELTALKTTHKRGLGLLRIYKFTVKLSPPSDGIYYIELTIDFSDNFAPFPYIEAVPVVLSGTSAISTDGGVQYSSNGLSCIMRFTWISSTPNVDTVYLLSTSSIKSVLQRWW